MFLRGTVLIITSLLSQAAFSLSPAALGEKLARGNFSSLKNTNGNTVIQNNLGISGSPTGNIGKGNGGVNLTQVATGNIYCPESYNKVAEGSVGGVSFKCRQANGVYKIYYCTNSTMGNACNLSDFGLFTSSQLVAGNVTIIKNSCDNNKKTCSFTVKKKKKKNYNASSLETEGRKQLNNDYANNSSVASSTLGMGVYDEQGHLIQAGKNPNMGKYQETILNKQATIDCANRQFGEIEDKGKTATCGDPNRIITVFDKSASANGCHDISTCIDSTTVSKKHTESCTVNYSFSKITQTDTTPHYACTVPKSYTKTCATVISVSVSNGTPSCAGFKNISVTSSGVWNNPSIEISCVNNKIIAASKNVWMVGYSLPWYLLYNTTSSFNKKFNLESNVSERLIPNHPFGPILGASYFSLSISWTGNLANITIKSYIIDWYEPDKIVLTRSFKRSINPPIKINSSSSTICH